MIKMIETVGKVGRMNTITNTVCLTVMVGTLAVGAIKGFKSLAKSVTYIK